MARIFITGSADGLGRAAADVLLLSGHQVIVHARTRTRLGAVRDLLDRVRPHPAVADVRFQDALLDALGRHTGAFLAQGTLAPTPPSSR